MLSQEETNKVKFAYLIKDSRFIVRRNIDKWYHKYKIKYVSVLKMTFYS